ncbi:hypothetical protein [Uliginosibacterium sp. H1]|uniref:hypothetical protein n=1 Tax=Uliginosibacterium sp. H1 TaxID=3114757 RepID=UPI002E184B70|nr:hypothetical protein [Uliginosibacterium sp. H1]
MKPALIQSKQYGCQRKPGWQFWLKPLFSMTGHGRATARPETGPRTTMATAAHAGALSHLDTNTHGS